MTDPDAYRPIACEFYDELGRRMLRERPCRLLIEADGTREVLTAQIDDLYSEAGAEYVRLASGRTIRLDRIAQVDDVRRSPS